MASCPLWGTGGPEERRIAPRPPQGARFREGRSPSDGAGQSRTSRRMSSPLYRGDACARLHVNGLTACWPGVARISRRCSGRNLRLDAFFFTGEKESVAKKKPPLRGARGAVIMKALHAACGVSS